MKLLAFLLVAVAARKAPKKFESATEMTLDAPAIESSKDQLFCVAPPDAPAASLIFGWVVGVSRKTKNFHETVRVATKWTLRCIAVSLLHNAFKAPVAQFLVYLVLIALYARTRVLKATGKKEYYREEKAE